ncbi:MAG: aminopeptidase N [Candidatus Paceibacteria bacterium]|jgi:aminopeptidase N
MIRKIFPSALVGAGLSLALILGGCRSSRDISASSIARSHDPRTEPVDVEHYSLELWLDPEERSIEGRCRIGYRVVDQLLNRFELDLAGLEVKAVTNERGHPLDFEHDGEKLRIELPQTLHVGDLDEVTVTYSGKPAKGLWYVKDEGGKVVQAWTQGECVDAHWWFPCMNYPADKATSEVRVHMPSAWVSVAAGERIDMSLSGESRMEHWRMGTPHSPYLMTLCAGEFHVVEEQWDGIPLIYMADARYSNWMADSFAETADILAYFSELTGKRYPYPKYSQACVKNFPFGGMENISATTLTETTLTDAVGQRDATSHGLVAHEAAHQWMGDLLTCATWSEIWLNEGFATYFTNLYFEHSRGLDDFRVRMRDTQNSYTAADIGLKRRPTVHDIYKDPFDLFFDGKAYAGGASRLHLLRYELGDDAFFKGLRLYVAGNSASSVNTEDLRAAMETASNKDLEGFFGQWLYGAGYPELEVHWVWEETTKKLELTVNQTQSTDHGTPSIFHFDVDVEVRDGEGKRTERLTIDQRRQTFEFPVNTRPIWVRFDKHSHLPARVISVKKGSEWLAIAAEDDDVNGRRDAVDALGRLCATEQDPGTKAVLSAAILRRLRDDDSEAVRLEAVEAFGRIAGEEGRLFLEQSASEDESAAVRAAALRSLILFKPGESLAAFAAAQFDVGYSWNTRTASAELYAAAAPALAREWLLARSNIPSPHAVLRAGLLEVLISLRAEGLPAELREYAANEDLAAAVRRVAVKGLGDYARLDKESRALLLELLPTDDYRLRQEVIDALANAQDPVVLQRLQAELKTSLHSRERRKLELAIAKLSRLSN